MEYYDNDFVLVPYERGWNIKHENYVKYPDNPELEAALQNFRQQFTWYEQQLKYRRSRGVDPTGVEQTWNTFLKLRKLHAKEAS